MSVTGNATAPVDPTRVGILTPGPNGYLTGAQHNEFLAVRDRIRKAFSDAAAQRDKHADRHAIVDSIDALGRPDKQMFFVDFEMRAMLAAVNAEREKAGLVPLGLADIARVEQSASGHSDYAAKYALYCAELVAYGVRTRVF